jgi:hypothetical protein
MKRYLSIILLLFSAAAAVFALDFGLIAGGEGEYAAALKPGGFSAEGNLSPWFSGVLGERNNFHISGKMTYRYAENREPGFFLFELERTEITLRPVTALHITLGRQRFQDAAGLVVAGLFDGLGSSLTLGPCRLFLGVYYTGLLYKETANIIMTAGDFQTYGKALEAPDLEGYFASRRVLLSLEGKIPDLTPRISLTVQGLAQFDLNKESETLNTQYLEVQMSAEPADPLYINLGILGELAQGGVDSPWSGAAYAGLDWEVPGALQDMVSGEFRWTMGKAGPGVRAFTPISGGNAGKVFDAGLPALMSGGIRYRSRPLSSFSLEAGGAYFIRTDLETLRDAELDSASESRLLGGEISCSAAWAPDAALRLNAGGGAFFPGWGGAFRADAPVRWKLSLGLLLAL